METRRQSDRQAGDIETAARRQGHCPSVAAQDSRPRRPGSLRAGNRRRRGTSQSNISQHLAILREKTCFTRKTPTGLLSVGDSRTLQLIGMMREVFAAMPTEQDTMEFINQNILLIGVVVTSGWRSPGSSSPRTVQRSTRPKKRPCSSIVRTPRWWMCAKPTSSRGHLPEACNIPAGSRRTASARSRNSRIAPDPLLRLRHPVGKACEQLKKAGFTGSTALTAVSTPGARRDCWSCKGSRGK